MRVLCIGGQTPDYTILSLDRASYFPDIDVTLGMTVRCRYIFALLWLADSYDYWSLIGPGQTRNKANPIQFVATELPTYLLKAVVSKLNNNYVFWIPLTDAEYNTKYKPCKFESSSDDQFKVKSENLFSWMCKAEQD